MFENYISFFCVLSMYSLSLKLFCKMVFFCLSHRNGCVKCAGGVHAVPFMINLILHIVNIINFCFVSLPSDNTFGEKPRVPQNVYLYLI